MRINRPQNLDLVLSPSKPPLSEIRISQAVERAETVTKIIENRSKNQRISDLVLLQKQGRSDAIVNLTNHEFNFLINQILPLVSSQDQREQAKMSEELKKSMDSEIQDGKNMIRSLNEQICGFEILTEDLKERCAKLESEVEGLKAEAELCKVCHKSTLELTNAVAVGELDFRLERYRLENLTRLNDFDVIISAMKSKMPTETSPGGPSPRKIPRMKAADFMSPFKIEHESQREKVLQVVDDEALDMPPLEKSTDEAATDSEDEVVIIEPQAEVVIVEPEAEKVVPAVVYGPMEKPIWWDKVVPQPEVWTTEATNAFVSEMVDMCARSAVNRVERRERDLAKQAKGWTARSIITAPKAFQVMTQEEAKNFETLEDKQNNHFSILLTGMQVPPKVKKLETVRKYEREYAIQMTTNLYPQFHGSNIKYIKSLKPPGQPWSKPYSLKVTFKAEHVRHHVLSAAAHANLLVRPYMNPRQFETFKQRQVERYQIQGTNVPGPAFLANGGYVPKRIHPSMEAGFEAWEKEYQRRKQFPSREIRLGPRGRTHNMTVTTINMPADPVEDKYWSNALERAYRLHRSQSVPAPRTASRPVQTPVPMPFRGPIVWDQNISRARAAPPTATTVTLGSNWQPLRITTNTSGMAPWPQQPPQGGNQ